MTLPCRLTDKKRPLVSIKADLATSFSMKFVQSCSSALQHKKDKNVLEFSLELHIVTCYGS